MRCATDKHIATGRRGAPVACNGIITAWTWAARRLRGRLPQTEPRPLSHARWSEPLRIDRPEGLLLRCVSGVAWVTLDGVREDLVLEAGSVRRLHGCGPALVSGMPACTVQVEPAEAPSDRRDEPGA